jgi:hypothetical protein
MAESQKDVDYSIKPEATTPAVDTSDWPLLLKNYNNRTIGNPQWEEYLLTEYLSSRPNGPFHSYPQWMYTPQARPQIVHQFWCYKS